MGNLGPNPTLLAPPTACICKISNHPGVVPPVREQKKQPITADARAADKNTPHMAE